MKETMINAAPRNAFMLTAFVFSACVNLIGQFSTGACYAQTSSANTVAPRQGKEAGEKVLRHAVFFKFKESATEGDVRRIVEGFAQLPSRIEEIEAFEWGRNIGESPFAGDHTHCFLVTFRDEAGRDAYLPHPAHKEFVAMLRPHLEKAFVIDYWGQPQKTLLQKELKHAVFFQFKEDASAEAVEAVENALAELPAKIDAIKAFEWGRNNSPEGLNDSFTHCFMFTFASEEGLKEYSDHPAHQAVVRLLRPQVELIRVFDFWTKK